MGIRVVVIDDNPHVSWRGRVYPANATFHRFLSAVLDVEGRDGRPAIASIVHGVPLRDAPAEPATRPLDPRLEVVGTAPFDGIAGFLRHAPSITRRNARRLRPVIASADLVWIKVPASNALLAAWLARRAGIARFVTVAGSAADVVAAQSRGPLGDVAARLVAGGYDRIGRLVGIGGDRVVVGQGLVAGDGLVTSLVEPGEIRSVSRPPPANPRRQRLAWAGRLASGKGIETLLAALGRLAVAGPSPAFELELLGDGPARAELERLASASAGQRVTFRGHVADRATYLDALAAADLFVFPSPAEGFPKVVLDAMAVGLPVVASPSGTMAELGEAGLIEAVPAGDPVALATAIRRLAAEPARAAALREAGTRFVAAHTRPAEAARIVGRWRRRFPGLPWG